MSWFVKSIAGLIFIFTTAPTYSELPRLKPAIVDYFPLQFDVPFNRLSSSIQPGADEILRKNVTILDDMMKAGAIKCVDAILIRGHALPEENPVEGVLDIISGNRANAVRDWLVSHDVIANEIITSGHGSKIIKQYAPSNKLTPVAEVLVTYVFNDKQRCKNKSYSGIPKE